MWWKCLEFLGKLSSNISKESFGFKSLKCPPAVEQMADFELDLMNIIKNLEFRKVSNVFQEQLKSDIEEIKNNNKIFVSADQSRNTYMLQQEEYTNLLKETSPRPTRNQPIKNYLKLSILLKRSQKNCRSLIG